MSSEELAAVLAVVLERVWIPEPLKGRVTYFSDYDLWQYKSALWVGHTCNPCAMHDNGLFQGSRLRMMFPYMQIVSEDEIEPRVHPRCLCKMSRLHGADLITVSFGVDNLDWLLDRELD